MEELKPHLEPITQNSELDTNIEEERLERIARISQLVGKINESSEKLPFPGIRPEAYLGMKEADNKYPGCATPIDELIARFRREGIRVTLGEHPESGNVFVLPVGGNDIIDIIMDSILLNKLRTKTVTNKHLAELIRLTTP